MLQGVSLDRMLSNEKEKEKKSMKKKFRVEKRRKKGKSVNVYGKTQKSKHAGTICFSNLLACNQA